MTDRNIKPVLSVYQVTVTRERLVRETRSVQVIARSAHGAKMLAKQKRPRDGWIQEPIKKGLNSAETTRHLESVVKRIGVADGLPDDPVERHRLLNDSVFVVRIEGEY